MAGTKQLSSRGAAVGGCAASDGGSQRGAADGSATPSRAELPAIGARSRSRTGRRPRGKASSRASRSRAGAPPGRCAPRPREADRGRARRPAGPRTRAAPEGSGYGYAPACMPARMILRVAAHCKRRARQIAALRGVLGAKPHGLVADRRLLPDLSAQLPRHRRRRRGRPGGHPAAPRPSGLARRRRGLDLALLPLADEGLRLRRLRLLRRRSPVRNARRLRPPAGRGARARPARDHRLGSQPHERPAPVVPRGARLAELAQARLVRLARRHPGPAAEQLAGRLSEGPRLDLGRSHRAVVPAPLPARAARPELGQPGGAWRRCTTRCASGSTAASTASGWT